MIKTKAQEPITAQENLHDLKHKLVKILQDRSCTYEAKQEQVKAIREQMQQLEIAIHDYESRPTLAKIGMLAAYVLVVFMVVVLSIAPTALVVYLLLQILQGLQ